MIACSGVWHELTRWTDAPGAVKFGRERDPSNPQLQCGTTDVKLDGKGKGNNSLLGNEIYCNELKQNIDILNNELHDVEPQMKWELFKFKIRHFTSKFSKKNCHRKAGKSTKMGKYCEEL